jgi:hypothetical protein
MKLVIVFNDTDGYTWSDTKTIPIEYESEEQLIVDLEEWAKKTPANYHTWKDTAISPSVIFGTKEYGKISIMTLKKWFEENKVEL